jgi:DNA-binding transcriptional LysR family regulator
VQLDLDAGLLAKLPVRLEGTFRPIGMTLRAHTTPSPAARAFMDVLRRIAPTVPACRT